MFSHRMIRDIHDQPRAIKETLEANEEKIRVMAEDIIEKDYGEIFIAGCSTSLFGGMVAQYALQDLIHKPIHALAASELADYSAVKAGDLVIALSRSGESGDVLRAVEESKRAGADILGITASLESSLARQSDYLLLTKVGDEGLVMIKSYITEVAASLLLSLQLARCGGFISDGQFEQLHKELVASPDEVRRITEEKEELMRSLAEEYQKSRSIFLLGNGPNFPTALEGMLKLKECTYAHAEAVSSNEFRHGYINALIKDTPAILIAPLSSRSHRQLVAIGRDVKNVDGRLVVLGTKGDDVLKELADHFVEMPSGYGELISPILYIVPLQLLAYYGALARGINPDEPERSVIFMSKKTLDGVERVFLAQS